jgi:hypothetical protein
MRKLVSTSVGLPSVLQGKQMVHVILEATCFSPSPLHYASTTLREISNSSFLLHEFSFVLLNRASVETNFRPFTFTSSISSTHEHVALLFKCWHIARIEQPMQSILSEPRLLAC